MAYTLQHFLDQKIVPRIRLLTESRDFSGIVLRSSQIEEPPFDESFSKDMLVITKIMGWEHDHALMEELVEIAASKGVAAMLWALEEKGSHIPESVIRKAEQGGIPLFEIPWEYPFAKVQEDLHDAIRAEELSLFEDVQQSLMDRFFESVPIKDCPAYLSHRFQRPVEILGADNRPLGVGRDTLFGRYPLPLDVEIRISGIRYGLLRFHLTGKEDPLASQVELLDKHVAFPLSLWFHRKSIEQVTERRIRNDFVWSLSGGNYSSLGEMRLQGKALGFDLSLPYVGILLRVDLEEEGPLSPAYTQENAGIAARIESLLRAVGAEQKLRLMTASLNLDFALFLEVKEPREERLNDFLDRCEERVLKFQPRAHCLWGISEFPGEETDFAESYHQAQMALSHCVGSGGHLRRFLYRRTRKAVILAALAKDEALRKNAQEVLGDLLDYDEGSQVELLRTLTEYISCNYNASRTAERLHLNRQSLLYRLKKIEQLTGMSLHDHDDLFVLEAFSRIYSSY